MKIVSSGRNAVSLRKGGVVMVSDNKNFLDAGLLMLRLGLGVMFIYHGWPKLAGGIASWEGLGRTMGMFGVSFAPAFWGFMAAFAEVFGGIALMTGLLFAPFCILLVIDMVVAATMHLTKGQGLAAASHAIECGIVFFSLIFTGPGRFRMGGL